MRVVRLRSLSTKRGVLHTAVCFWIIAAPPVRSARAQVPAPADQNPAAPSDIGPRVEQRINDPAERPPTPEELRKKQLDLYDPKAKDPRITPRATPNKQGAADDSAAANSSPEAKPLPGSVAESNLPPVLRRDGPEVTGGGDNTADQQYNGPAVLSRSYTLTRPMVPRQIRWSWTVSGGESYTSGLLSPVATSSGQSGAVGSLGTIATFSTRGRHLWKRDQIGVNYSIGYNRYGSQAAYGYNGSNQTLNLDYEHQFSPHLTLNVVESASSLTQSGTLLNPLGDAGVSVANLDLAASPTIQPLDLQTKQSTTQISVTWQQSARLSFSYSAGLFGAEFTGPQLMGNSGYQGQTDVNYRITRKTTVGAYYSYVSYVYSHHFAASDTQTVGLIYSYAIGKSMQIRTRGGLSMIDSKGLTQAPVNPVFIALVGTPFGIVDSETKLATSDVSAEIVKDFGSRRTASVSYAHGVSPGNGMILTSTQQVISASLGMTILKRYSISLSAGQTDLTATLATLGSFKSDFATMTVTRALPNNLSGSLSFSYRKYSAIGEMNVLPQFIVSTGVSWGPGEGKLW